VSGAVLGAMALAEAERESPAGRRIGQWVSIAWVLVLGIAGALTVVALLSE
jgi:hypothetical protein